MEFFIDFYSSPYKWWPHTHTQCQTHIHTYTHIYIHTQIHFIAWVWTPLSPDPLKSYELQSFVSFTLETWKDLEMTLPEILILFLLFVQWFHWKTGTYTSTFKPNFFLRLLLSLHFLANGTRDGTVQDQRLKPLCGQSFFAVDFALMWLKK